MKLIDIRNLQYGKDRREKLILWLKNQHYNNLVPDKIPVNKAGMMNIKDPDLQYLLKRGILEIYRPRSIYARKNKKSSTGRQTYLILK